MRELQRICMEHTWPAEWIVYDDDPQALKTRDPALIRGRFIGEPGARFNVARQIPEVTELMNRDKGYLPPLFIHGRRKGHGQTLATVQIGRRRSPSSNSTQTGLSGSGIMNHPVKGAHGRAQPET